MRRAAVGLLLAAWAGVAAPQPAEAPASAPPPVVREIVFRGNTITQPKVMLREMFVRVGDRADPALLERSRQGILDLGLFRAVRLEQEELPDGVRLVFTVREKIYILPLPRASASSDGGYNYGAQVRWNNVAGLDHSFNAYWDRREKSEGEADPEDRGLQTRYLASYYAPFVFDSPYGVLLSGSHVDSPLAEPVAYDEVFNHLSFTVTRKLFGTPGTQGWTAGAGLLYQNEYTSGANAPPSYGNATAVTALANYRDMRFKVYSDEGRQFNGSLEVATEGVASDYHYVKWELGYLGSMPIGRTPHQSLRFSGGVGSLHGGPPDTEAFELGGSGYLRGFEPESAQGDFAYLLQLEYLRPVVRNSIRTLIVLEAGNAFAEPGDLKFDRVLVSAGLGVRVRIQAFVNLDVELGVAWPLNGGDARVFASKI